MNHARSSQQPKIHIPSFPLPATKADFDALTYTQRVVLAEQHPAIYNKFAHPKERKPWEK